MCYKNMMIGKKKKKDVLRSSDLTPVAEDSDRMH